jgi:hypothetical protein
LAPLTEPEEGRLLRRMGHTILSIAEARRAARLPDQYLVWVKQQDAVKFQEPGWVKLEPPRDDAVLFIHPQRELSVVRQRGIV